MVSSGPKFLNLLLYLLVFLIHSYASTCVMNVNVDNYLYNYPHSNHYTCFCGCAYTKIHVCLGMWKTSIGTTLGSTQVFSTPRIRGWVWPGSFCYTREGMELGADPWKNWSSSLPLQSSKSDGCRISGSFFQHTQIVPRCEQAGGGAEPFSCP